MPTNRRQRRREAVTHLSPVAVAAYRLAREIEATGLHTKWEDEGGRQREYLNAHRALDEELGLPPWPPSPLDARPIKDDGSVYAELMPEAIKLREALESA